mmetsp:Transcript_25118/g.38485  ORF Transcript_25118/g.38485 Transcript_25118/m.38485 type:complete len:208 (+) Transcript_25118:160-783(+)
MPHARQLPRARRPPLLYRRLVTVTQCTTIVFPGEMDTRASNARDPTAFPPMLKNWSSGQSRRSRTIAHAPAFPTVFSLMSSRRSWGHCGSVAATAAAPLFPMWLHAMFKPCRPLQSESAAATAWIPASPIFWLRKLISRSERHTSVPTTGPLDGCVAARPSSMAPPSMICPSPPPSRSKCCSCVQSASIWPTTAAPSGPMWLCARSS